MSTLSRKAAEEYFGDKPFRHVQLGEKILDGDVFVVDGMKVYPATDTGNGVMSQDHWPHYREAK